MSAIGGCVPHYLRIATSYRCPEAGLDRPGHWAGHSTGLRCLGPAAWLGDLDPAKRQSPSAPPRLTSASSHLTSPPHLTLLKLFGPYLPAASRPQR